VPWNCHARNGTTRTVDGSGKTEVAINRTGNVLVSLYIVWLQSREIQPSGSISPTLWDIQWSENSHCGGIAGPHPSSMIQLRSRVLPLMLKPPIPSSSLVWRPGADWGGRPAFPSFLLVILQLLFLFLLIVMRLLMVFVLGLHIFVPLLRFTSASE
jgi:hypothetical protein